MKNYVIIGNGVAATGCIEGIRSVDKDSKITVVSAENYPVYCRPLISYYLEEKTTLQKMNYRPCDFYDVNGCEVIYGKSAVSVDKDKKNVLLDDGTEISYDLLCIASGSSPFVPPFNGSPAVSARVASALNVTKSFATKSAAFSPVCVSISFVPTYVDTSNFVGSSTFAAITILMSFPRTPLHVAVAYVLVAFSPELSR